MRTSANAVRPGTTHESIYTGVTRWAAQAESHLLQVMALAGVLGSLAVVLVDSSRWPVVTPMITMATIAGWGLLKRGEGQLPTRARRLLEAALVALGSLAAVVAAFALLVWIMGPAPIL